jgi:hypothetical protein
MRVPLCLLNNTWRLKSAVLVIALLVLLSPPALQSTSGEQQHYSSAQSESLFFGATQATILSGTSIQLSLNVTNPETSPATAIAQVVVGNVVTGVTLEIQNSSLLTLQPNTPTIVNVTLTGLTLCTNYSLAIHFDSASGAALTPEQLIYEFPCEVYGNAVTIEAAQITPGACVSNCVNATVVNDLDTSITTLIFAVVHNQAGQTISANTGTVTIGAGNNETVLIATTTVPQGQYNVTVFAWDETHVPISQPYSFSSSIG